MNASIESGSGRFTLIAAVVAVAVLLVSTILLARQADSLRNQIDQLQTDLDRSRHAVKPASPSNDREVAILRQMLEEKEKAYNTLLAAQRQTGPSETGTVSSTSTDELPVSGNVSAATFTSAQPGRSWLDQLRDQDPERYRQIQEERESRRQRFEQRIQDYVNQLDTRLQSATTQEEADLVRALTDSIHQMNDLRQSWESLRDLPAEERREQFQQLAQQSRALYEQYAALRAQDRQMQLRRLAAQVGYRNPAQIEQFSTAIDQIYRDTDASLRGLMEFGMGGPGGGRGRSGR